MINVIIIITVLSCNFGPMILGYSLPFAELYLYRYMIVIMLFYAILCKLKRNGIVTDKVRNRIQYKFLWFYLAWSIYAIISYFWVEDVGAWFRSIFFITQGFFTIIIWGEVLKRRDAFKSIFLSFTLLNLFFNIFGWYEYMTSKYIFLGMTDRIAHSIAKGNSIPRVIFDNENGFAYILTFLLFTTFLGIIKNKGTEKFLYSCLTVSTFALIILIQSRGAIVAVIIGSIFLFVFINKVTLKNKLLRKIASLGIVSAIIFLGIQMWASGKIKINDFGSDFVRINLVKEGLAFVMNTYGRGVGAGNIEYWMKNYSILDIGDIVNIHNWWLELITGYGIIIFIWYIVMFAYLIYLNIEIMKDIRQEYEIRLIGLVFATILITFIIGSMVPSSIVSSEWTWMMFGIMIGFVTNYSGEIRRNN